MSNGDRGKLDCEKGERGKLYSEHEYGDRGKLLCEVRETRSREVRDTKSREDRLPAYFLGLFVSLDLNLA